MKLSGVFGRFSLIYILLMIIAAIVMSYFEIASNSGVNISILAGATIFSCTSFAKKNERYFTNKEKRKVVFGFILINLLIQGLIGFASLSDASVGVLLFPLVAVGVIHSIYIYFIVGITKKVLVK
jgi:phosphatidylglycerophosphate synthase